MRDVALIGISFALGLMLNIYKFKNWFFYLKQFWMTERELFNRKEFAEDNPPRTIEMIDRATILGYGGSLNFYGLCAWAGISSNDCAGPRSNEGRRRALIEIEKVIQRRETSLQLNIAPCPEHNAYD